MNVLLVLKLVINPSFVNKNKINIKIMKYMLIFIVLIYTTSSIFSLTSRKFIQKPSPSNNIEKFTCNKQNIQKMVDPRFSLKYLMDNYIPQDKTLRFLSTDISKAESRYTKLYFKGDPKQCQFHNHGFNPSFSDALEDCNNHKNLINRLYNRKADNETPLGKGDKPIYKTIGIPQCLSSKDPQGVKTHYMNIFGLPTGQDLGTRCIVGEFLTKSNSCMILLRKVSKSVLKVLSIFNAGTRFFKHGNIIPQNIYLFEKKDKNQVFVDNMLFDTIKYDDKDNKPFKSDFNMLADLLVTLLSGSETFKLKDPKNTFHVYAQIKKYYEKNEFAVGLNTFHLNMPKKFMSTPKCVTLAELEWLLRDTFFNFLYRLKCTGTNKKFRFVEISQALKHAFMLKPKTSQTWDALPAEY